MGVEANSPDPMASLTGALVDANDRLLGMLSLITNDPPTSLAAVEMIDSIVERAAPILDLNRVVVTGATEHTWAVDLESDDEATWATTIDMQEIGIVDLLFTRKVRRFDTGDTKLLAAVARLLANAVATAHVHQQTLAQEVVAREHGTAAQVAAAALPDPDSMPRPSGLSFFASLTPARETGGDLYTWQEIDDSVWFAMGDVSGKGLPAAVLMSTAVSAVDASIARSHAGGPTAVVTAVDNWLHHRLSNASMFITLAIGEWNTRTNQLTIANSGHSPIVWCSNGTTTRVDATAPPVGVILGCETEPWIQTTSSGDLLVLATDGFTEQDNVQGDMFGEERFDERVLEHSNADSADEIGQILLDEVAEHGRDCVQSDDRALMVLRFS